MRKQENVTVDGEQYMITMLHPDNALEVWAWLMNRFGGSLVKLFSSLPKGQKLTEMMTMNVSDAAGALNFESIGMEIVANIKSDEVKQNAKVLLSTVHQKNQPVDYVTHFMGRPGHMMRVIIKAIQVNFADFFSASQGGVQRVHIEKDTSQARQM